MPFTVSSAIVRSLTAVVLVASLPVTRAASDLVLSTPHLRVELPGASASPRLQVTEKTTGVTWAANPKRFAEITFVEAGKRRGLALEDFESRSSRDTIELTFKPIGERPEALVRISIRTLPGGRTLDFSYAAEGLNVESIRLFDGLLSVTDSAHGYAVVPVREGLLVPATRGRSFTNSFDTYAYEGCHMAMLGMVKSGSAAFVTWDDPYAIAELRSRTATNSIDAVVQQVMSPSLVLRKSARSFRIQFLGKGDYVTIGKAYRQIAKEKGLVVTWDQKLKTNPDRAQLFGASNYKLWSMLDRRMNDDSSREESAKVNWTFDEAAQVAEHLKHDLKLDKVLFMMGGWMNRGYDNQHPDVLPTAPECGGDAAFADCAQRVMRLGYNFSLHDNYQDIYRDSPSWNERWIQKNADGSLVKGGHWAGGRAFITCSKMALELAKRPQNLEAVKALIARAPAGTVAPGARRGALSYFIDTTYAAGLQECFDKEHPLTRADDMKWKQALSDYGRDVFGMFGSECGREWAIPHSDFFEGLTGVSGTYYHNKDLAKNLGATVVPLFEIVYRDCIALYGKYGYDPARAAEYVLHHIAIGRPMNYHIIPQHLYWKTPGADESLAIAPSVAELKQTASRQFTVVYRWNVVKPPTNDWRVFVHFTDGSGAIKFQNDHVPAEPLPQWKPGERNDGPFTVSVPAGLSGTFDVRVGLFQLQNGARANIAGSDADERFCVVGKLVVRGDDVTFEPARQTEVRNAGDPSLFTRGGGGWTEGLHVVDRFVKNTHEILSPLHEITARVPMTQHEFLNAERTVQRSVFGKGIAQVVVNGGRAVYRHKSKTWGDIDLPPYGFFVESPEFVAFHGLSWNGFSYAENPPLFTLRSEGGKPLSSAKAVRVFHAFGDPRLRLWKRTHTVEKETVVTRTASR